MGVDFNNPIVLSAYIISFIGFTLLTLASAFKRKTMILNFQTAANLLCGI